MNGEEVLCNMSSYGIMVDESTDVSVLKQLVLYGRAVVKGELKTRFLIYMMEKLPLLWMQLPLSLSP